MEVVTVHDLGLSADGVGIAGSPTKILDVFSPVANRENVRLKGAPKKIVETLLDRYSDKISGAIGKDLLSHEHTQEP